MYANERCGENAAVMNAPILLLHGTRRTDRPPPDWHAALLLALPYAKRLALERRAPEERAASLDALALLCVGLDRIGQGTGCVGSLRYDERGAPKLSGRAPAFSLTHSRSRVACAIAAECAALGIDVEDMDPSRIGAAETARLERWVATEAVLKAAGHGLRDADKVSFETDSAQATAGGGAGQVQFALHAGSRYRLQRVELDTNSVCRVAIPADRTGEIRVERADLDGRSVSVAVERALSLAP